MRTHLRESMLALLLIGILATGCDTGTKKASENSITFDSISVEKTYHLLDNPDNPNCNLEIKFVYPRKYSDKEVLKNLQRQFVSSYFGENYEQLSPEEAVRKYTDDYLAAYKDLEEDTRLRWRNPTRHRWALGSLTMRCRRMISPSTKTISSAIR